MRGTVFFSWQSDLPPRDHRYFIRDLIEDAVKLVKGADLTYDEATKDLPGSPEILAAIYRKIEAATFYVADFTPAWRGDDSEKSPNPNVLGEHGYALKALGWERTLRVLNVHYGAPEQLPFNYRSARFTIKYDLPPDSDSSARKELRARKAKELAAHLQSAIEAGVLDGLREPDRTVLRLLVWGAEEAPNGSVDWRLSEISERLPLVGSGDLRRSLDNLEGQGLLDRQPAQREGTTWSPTRAAIGRLSADLGWSPRSSARRIAQWMVDRDNQFDGDVFVEAHPDWSVCRINAATAELEALVLIAGHGWCGSLLRIAQGDGLPGLRLFAEGRHPIDEAPSRGR